MSNADTEVLGDNDGSASLGSALTGSATPAHIVYYLFEDPTYFDDWGAKGIPFRLAVRLPPACARRAVQPSQLAQPAPHARLTRPLLRP